MCVCKDTSFGCILVPAVQKYGQVSFLHFPAVSSANEYMLYIKKYFKSL